MHRFKTAPYAHQLACLSRFGDREYFALLSEMGTGKTWIVINNIADLWLAGKCDKVLVLAPNGVHENWTRLELPKHLPDRVMAQSVTMTWGAAQSKRTEASTAKFMSAVGKLKILTMNHEALQSKRGAEFATKFCAGSKGLMIVVDESDAYKNPSAARTKVLMKLRCHSTWRRIMTGTPVSNSPFDAFSQFNFLHPSILGVPSYFAFKAEYAELMKDNTPLLIAIKKRCGSWRTPQLVVKDKEGRPKYRNLDKLAKLIEPHSSRTMKSNCLDLPDKIYKTASFDLTAQQRVVYNKAETECRVAFQDEDVAFSRMTALLKLAQITSGFYLCGEDLVQIEGDNPKLELLADRVLAVSRQGCKTIVWARFRAEIASIVARLSREGIKCVEYHGDISGQNRTAAIDDFERGDADVFVGNQQAGGTGITLVAASFVIYYSNSFSLRDRLQSEDRAHRIGQTKSVTYINIVAKGTIDEVITEALMNKKTVADAVVAWASQATTERDLKC